MGLCDRQLIRRSPLQTEVTVVSFGGNSPQQLYCVIARALFDGQVGRRLGSWGKKIIKISNQNNLAFKLHQKMCLCVFSFHSQVRPNAETLLVKSPLCVMTSARYSLPGTSAVKVWLVCSAPRVWAPRVDPETSYNTTLRNRETNKSAWDSNWELHWDFFLF